MVTLYNLIGGLQMGSIYALIALGYTMVYGIVKLINFAHGDIMMVGAYAIYWMMSTTMMKSITATHPIVAGVVSVLFAVVVCVVLGVLIDRIAYKPLRNAPRLRAPGSGFSRPGTGTAQPVNEYHIKILRQSSIKSTICLDFPEVCNIIIKQIVI